MSRLSDEYATVRSPSRVYAAKKCLSGQKPLEIGGGSRAQAAPRDDDAGRKRRKQRAPKRMERISSCETTVSLSLSLSSPTVRHPAAITDWPAFFRNVCCGSFLPVRLGVARARAWVDRSFVTRHRQKEPDVHLINQFARRRLIQTQNCNTAAGQQVRRGKKRRYLARAHIRIVHKSFCSFLSRRRRPVACLLIGRTTICSGRIRGAESSRSRRSDRCSLVRRRRATRKSCDPPPLPLPSLPAVSHLRSGGRRLVCRSA